MLRKSPVTKFIRMLSTNRTSFFARENLKKDDTWAVFSSPKTAEKLFQDAIEDFEKRVGKSDLGTNKSLNEEAQQSNPVTLSPQPF